MKLENVRIINYNKQIDNADVTLENGIIKTIELKEGMGTKILIPGFIDTHTHGLLNNDFMDGVEAVEQITEDLAKFGVTSVYATIMTRSIPVMNEALKNISMAKSRGSNILGIHAEGPFISLAKKGAHNPDEILKGDVSVLTSMNNASKGMLKKVSFAPEEVDSDFIDKMLELGIMPTIGHTNASFEQTIEAIESGSLHSTHLWNAMSGVQNRNPGVAQAVIFDSRIYAELITDLVHVDKDTIMFTMKTKTPDKIVLVTDSIRPAGLPDGPSESGGINIVKTGSKIVLEGTDTIAGSGATMIDNFRNLVNLGIELTDIVKMSSYNSAKSLSLKGKGVIQEGMDADLILMNDKFEIEEVYVNGINKK